MNIFSRITSWATERGITQQLPDKNGFVKNIVSELGEFIDDTGEYAEIDAIADIMVFCITEIPKYGKDPALVLQEVYKEINSRTGAWSKEEQKWLKFKTPEAMELWVAADYSKCSYLVDDTTKELKEELRQILLEETHLS